MLLKPGVPLLKEPLFSLIPAFGTDAVFPAQIGEDYPSVQ
jgi:hypothetical protein